ncbi:MAG: hypothetical protein WDZ41_05355 [Candidatus Babeliales bacterium]
MNWILCLFLTLFINNFHITNSNQHETPSKQSNFTLSYEICMNQLNTLEYTLLEILTALHDHLEYWEQLQLRPIRRFISNGPLKWFKSQSQTIEIKDHVKVLQQEIENISRYIGYLHEIKQQKKSASANFAHQELYRLAHIINKCLDYSDPNTQPIIKENLEQELNILLMKNKKKLAHFKNTMNGRIAIHKKPSHFSRHWLEYSIGALSALSSLAYWYKNHDKVNKWVHDTHTSGKNFYHNYAYQPIQNIIDIFYGKYETKELITTEEIKNLEEMKREGIINFYKKHTNLAEQEIKKIAEEAIQQKTLPELIRKKWLETSPNALWNVLIGSTRLPYIGNKDAIWLALLKIDDGIITGKSALLLGQDILKANSLNQQILVAIPAVLTILGGCYTIKKAYNLFKKNPFDYIQKELISIESILNKYNNSSMSIDYTALGLIHYHEYKILNNIDCIPVGDQARFIRDLSELDSLEFSIPQKIATINRMYRAYPFLVKK